MPLGGGSISAGLGFGSVTSGALTFEDSFCLLPGDFGEVFAVGGGQVAFCAGPQSVDSGSLPVVCGACSVVGPRGPESLGCAVPLVGVPVALLRGEVAPERPFVHLGGPALLGCVMFVCQCFALVCDAFPLVGYPVPLVGYPVPLVSDAIPLVSYPVSLIGGVFALVCQDLPGIGDDRGLVGLVLAAVHIRVIIPRRPKIPHPTELSTFPPGPLCRP